MKTQALDTILDPALGLDILPADPDFPQLNIACDRERMLDVFRTHLKPASEKSYAILDCTPFRFRCRQATSRCVLQYTLRLLEPGTGRVRKLSVTGLIYAQDGAAERVWQEMQADNPRREIPDSWLTFEPVCFIPELKMVVEVFPYDRRLRVIPRFMAGPVSQLEPLLLARFGPGEWRVEERDVQPARYRTEIGVVLRYTFKARNTATAVRQMRCFYVKIYRENRGAETFQLLQSLCARPEEEQKKFTVVQPVAWLDELNSLVVEEAPGRSLE